MKYNYLSIEEKKNIDEFFKVMKEKSWMGECGYPFISFIASLISANNITNIVQLGHFLGYSSIIIAMILRQSETKNSFISVDINPFHTEITDNFVKKFGLIDYVKTYTYSSTDESFVDICKNNRPNLIVIDSSHEYEQTIKELNIYYDMLQHGGFIILHDSSELAKRCDASGQGGVKRALEEFKEKNTEVSMININDYVSNKNTLEQNRTSYKDPSGICIIQKRAI